MPIRDPVATGLPMKRMHGFSLVEVAVVLVILSLVLGGLLLTMGTYQQYQRSQQTQRLLAEARDALVGHAVTLGRLPCPATAGGDGQERAPTGTGCTGGLAGELPWATLGLPRTDAWGRSIGYAVSAEFARNAASTFPGCPPGQPATPPANARFALCSVGTHTVQDLAAQPVGAQLPAVFWSQGPNGDSASAAENENRDGDSDFVASTPTDTFDDIVEWVPPTVLMNRMVQSGRLP